MFKVYANFALHSEPELFSQYSDIYIIINIPFSVTNYVPDSVQSLFIHLVLSYALPILYANISKSFKNKSRILRRRRYGHLVGPRQAPGCFQRPGIHLRQGGPSDQRREYSQHGLPSLSGGGRKPDLSGVQSEADGVGGKLCRETKRESGVRGVWGGNCGWFHVESFDDSTWEVHNTAAPLGPPDEWRAQYV